MTAELSALAWVQVDPDAVLAVPLGSTEQHGPHLPLSTDTRVAVALCEKLALARPDVVVAPGIAYGASGEHAAFPGTLSIGTEALALMLVELVRSATDTFRRVLLVNAHGGNGEAVRRAVQRLTGEGRDVFAWSPPAYGDAHAGRTESSLMLALAPSLVRAQAAAAGEARPLRELLPALRAGRLRELSPNGVLGDPTGACAEEGRTMLTRLVHELVTATALRWPR